MHDLLFQHQKDLRLERLLEHGKQLGLDLAAFTEALEKHRYLEIVRQDILDGMNRDVQGVPTFFINNRRVDGIHVSALLKVIDEELAQQSSKEEQAGVPETRARVAE